MKREEIIKMSPASAEEVAKLEKWYGELIAASALVFSDGRIIQVGRFIDSILITTKNEGFETHSIRFSPEGFAAAMNGYFDTYSDEEQASHHAEMVRLVKKKESEGEAS
jgi:hypothetical protein